GLKLSSYNNSRISGPSYKITPPKVASVTSGNNGGPPIAVGTRAADISTSTLDDLPLTLTVPKTSTDSSAPSRMKVPLRPKLDRALPEGSLAEKLATKTVPDP